MDGAHVVELNQRVGDVPGGERRADHEAFISPEFPAFENRNPLTYHHLGSARGLDTGYKVTPRMASALCWSGVDLSAR